ncbi:MAG: MotA/TolQ/ExbB proton channel family protein [Gammaproteobacteria bacterium]|nr:MotA/TolQ/ExbB proton channel family protein [Gammaproteobacteria bacterium]
MFEVIKAGGWVMLPIILCSTIALAIIFERFWALRRQRICPSNLVSQIWHWANKDELDATHIAELRSSSPLGRVLAAGLMNLNRDREIMKESIEDTGRHVVVELERYLNTLGTIAAISPLLGLLGTVLGMIRIFTAINVAGLGNQAVLAGGIAEALITTVAGLSVAIPSIMFYRYFRGRVDELVVYMEQQALKMVEILHGDRSMEAGAAS